MVITPAAEQLAHRLRVLRDESGLRQSELAEIFTKDGRKVGAAAISSWERQRNPVLVPENRIEPYSRLIALTGNPPKLPAEDDLTAPQRAKRDEVLLDLTVLFDQARGWSGTTESSRVPTYRSWFFADNGPVVIIAPDAGDEARGPLAESTHPNYTALHRFADQDALVELHGHIRAENDPALPVFFKRASRVIADDLSGHLVLIGGIGWNEVTRRLLKLLERLPVRQFESPELTSGDIFAVGHGAAEQRFLPVWSRANGGSAPELEEDVGLLARVPNPFNSSKTLTLCNGIHSRGVLGAVRTLTDARIREANESYLAEHFPDDEYGLLVRVPVFRGEALSPDLQDPENILYAWPQNPGSKPRWDRV
ncbi:helix-turn-helix transcriptional regulator [Actinoplanes sp. TBRC 11911]|uniref:helix-turn-helix domain-containing protein n=1 Tax=Actinoplanes sp. TBRC 11911 TaxID=2729386 RepID=UPI00145D8A06|nr:helix-turn-helix transcriptional regulator [Actinoplanes sp. TBRC 11911]NMO50814.1 helix-turn-helix transcriptional regulator [Actinoplanes sp. TBRC 11911]